MASKYAVLSGKRLARASDADVYNFAVQYAQAHAMGTPAGVVGAGAAAAPGVPTRFAPSARLELGRGQANQNTALARRKALAASLARRTTEASRQRVLNRIMAGYGVQV
jgi:hypothetical protein